MASPEIRRQIEEGLEKSTGFKFQEFVHSSGVVSVLGTEEAIAAVEALDLPVRSKGYDAILCTWFINLEFVPTAAAYYRQK